MSFDYLYDAVSWTLLRWHDLVSLAIDSNSGINWALSIVLLTITARLLLFRFFIRQVFHQRRMQEMQPKLAELRTKYKSDRAELNRQVLALQQQEGVNPFAGCLPLLLQIPIFIGLFHVLKHLANSAAGCPAGAGHHGRALTLYGFHATQTCSAAQAKLFGAPLAARLTSGAHQLAVLGGHLGATRVVVVLVVLISAAATFATQLLVRRASSLEPEGTAATVQRVMVIGIPVSTLASGLFFPLGVLIYWLTSNTATLLQQAYINRFHPPQRQ